MSYTVKSPETKDQLLTSISECESKNFRFGAGFTDLTLELKKNSDEELTIINLGRLKEEVFSSIRILPDKVRFGSLVTASELSSNNFISTNYPVLHQSAFCLGSYQVRQLATIGGNICTASPSGDIANAFVALKADCEILNSDGLIKVIPIGDFLQGVRKTALKKNEVLQSLLVDKNSGENIHSGFIKCGTRLSMECSVVSLAYHIITNKKNIIVKAGISIGAAAPTIKFAAKAVEYLINKELSGITKADAIFFAKEVIKYASPISDVRASAWYREEVLFNLCKSIFED